MYDCIIHLSHAITATGVNTTLIIYLYLCIKNSNITHRCKIAPRRLSERGVAVLPRGLSMGWTGGGCGAVAVAWVPVGNYVHAHAPCQSTLSIARVFGFDNNRYRAGFAAAAARKDGRRVSGGPLHWGRASVGWAGRAFVCMYVYY